MIHTFKQAAENFQLWKEYVDPNGVLSEADFNRMSVESKIEVQRKAFNETREALTDAQINLLDELAVGVQVYSLDYLPKATIDRIVVLNNYQGVKVDMENYLKQEFRRVVRY